MLDSLTALFVFDREKNWGVETEIEQELDLQGCEQNVKPLGKSNNRMVIWKMPEDGRT